MLQRASSSAATRAWVHEATARIEADHQRGGNCRRVDGHEGDTALRRLA